MYGDEVLKLIREAKRTQAGMLPPYNESIIRNVIKELRILCEEQQKLMNVMNLVEEDEDDEAQGYKTAFLVHHACIERNKRCLLAYHVQRMEKIKTILWDLGSLPRDMQGRFSPTESKFSENYSGLLVSYKGIYDAVDLSAVLVPPKELFVCVRVLKDCGEIFTENGKSVVLKPNTQHFLKRSDVERLITQGYLKHVD
jgi:GINS complex subunit 1